MHRVTTFGLILNVLKQIHWKKVLTTSKFLYTASPLNFSPCPKGNTSVSSSKLKHLFLSLPKFNISFFFLAIMKD